MQVVDGSQLYSPQVEVESVVLPCPATRIPRTPLCAREKTDRPILAHFMKLVGGSKHEITHHQNHHDI